MPDEHLIQHAERVLDAARARGKTITTAESCTGGLLAACLTEVEGASDVFDRGFITYSNEGKTDLLGVGIDLLANFGAVSEEVARAMAEGALMRSQADVGLSITGIAGPSGGSQEKPVGLVWFGVATREGITIRLTSEPHMFGNIGRTRVRHHAAETALGLLLTNLRDR